MLARERTSYLCPSLLDRWHLQCAAGLELDGDGGPGGLALRSLMGLWSPALALPGWVCLLVGVSARLECTTAELSASYPDPLATCLSPSPVLLRIGLLGRIYRCVACLLCGEASIDARTIEAFFFGKQFHYPLYAEEQLKRLARAVRYGALGTCSALSALGII